MTITNHKYLIIFLLCTLFGITSVIVLFNVSEERMHHQNPFIRRYYTGTFKDKEIDLKYDSYYFAGKSGKDIFLGNTTAPLIVTFTDTMLSPLHQKHIAMPTDKRRDAFTLRIRAPFFYLIDGTRSAIYMGSQKDWRAELKWKGKNSFSQPQLTGSLSLVCTTIDPDSGESELAVLRFGRSPEFKIRPQLLEKQADGIFDNDGRLHYDDATQRSVYTYLYRNQIVSANNDLRLVSRYRTIDTISRAQIQVAYVKDHAENKFSAPPLVVNKTSAVSKNLLFVNSGLIGRYETKGIWDQASIIDVYDLSNNTYLSSFYVYNIGTKKLKSFFVTGNFLYAFIGKHLVRYRLHKMITSHYK